MKQYNILVTRPAHQAETLCHLIEDQGWNPIRFPALEIVAIENKTIRQQLETIKKYPWLIFISINAVNFALSMNNGKIDGFKGCSIAAVGQATAAALHSVGLSVDVMPETRFNTEGLLATSEMNQIKDKRCLIVRGRGGREDLANGLRQRGAIVEYMEVYSRERPVTDSSHITEMLEHKSIDAISITSGDALKNLGAMIDVEYHEKLQRVPLIVISNRIKELAEKIGFKRIVVTEKPEDAAIIKTAIKMGFQTQQLTNEEYSG